MVLPKTSTLVLALLILAVGGTLRLFDLGTARVHGDEAVQAYKAWDFAEYRYDPTEFHGPTLPWLTQFALLSADERNVSSLANATIGTFRGVVAVFSVTLLLLCLLLLPSVLGLDEARWGIFALSISPLCVYFSRVYIHESLLLGFSLLFLYSLYQLLTTRRCRWGFGCGLVAALMVATKETALLSFAAVGVTALSWKLWPSRGSRERLQRPAWASAATLLASSALAAAFLMSVGFRQPEALLDTWSSVGNYIDRARTATEHHHGVSYYFSRLVFFQEGSGPVFTEATLLALGIFGGVLGKAPAARMLFRYAVVLAVIYSSLDYKTPWCALQFHGPWCLLAGIGGVELWRRISHPMLRVLFVLTLTTAAIHLGWQSSRAIELRLDPRSPFAYAEPLSGVEKIGDWLPSLQATQDTYLRVAVIHHNCWPLPWYLRTFNATPPFAANGVGGSDSASSQLQDRVGYWDSVSSFLSTTRASSSDTPEGLPRQDPIDLYIVDAGELKLLEKYWGDRASEFEYFHYGLRREETLVVVVPSPVFERFATRSTR